MIPDKDTTKFLSDENSALRERLESVERDKNECLYANSSLREQLNDLQQLHLEWLYKQGQSDAIRSELENELSEIKSEVNGPFLTRIKSAILILFGQF